MRSALLGTAALGLFLVASARAGAETAAAGSQARWAADRAVSPLVPSRRLVLDPEPTAPATASPARSRYAWPMLLSALVPGAGEIATGHVWNGLPLVAADVATWLGYAHFQSEGDEWKSTYESFADAHWNEARWQTNLEFAASPQAGPNDWSTYWDPAAPHNCNCSPPYIPRAEDEREYYENLGKYNHFFPGWDDWSTSYVPENPATNRRQYVDMRIESNNNFDNAHAMLGVAAATRVLSVLQSFWLVRRDTRASLRVEPMLFRGAGSGLRLKWSF